MIIKSQQSQMSELLTESTRAGTRRGMGRPDAAWQCGRRRRISSITWDCHTYLTGSGLARAGQPVDQSEDIVQETLLAVHLKRHAWDSEALVSPWLFAIGVTSWSVGCAAAAGVSSSISTISPKPSPANPSRSLFRPANSSHICRACQDVNAMCCNRSPRRHFDQGDRYEVCHERGRRACGAASWIDQSRCQAAEAVR